MSDPNAVDIAVLSKDPEPKEEKNKNGNDKGKAKDEPEEVDIVGHSTETSKGVC
jgi:hypothetical protein